MKLVNDYDDYERPYEENRPGFCPDGPEIRSKTPGNGPGPASPGPTGRAGRRGGPGWASGPLVLVPLARGPGSRWAYRCQRYGNGQNGAYLRVFGAG